MSTTDPETQAERTRAVIEQTLAAHEDCGQVQPDQWACKCGWLLHGGDLIPRLVTALRAQHEHRVDALADEVARALAEQAQTTDTLTDNERTALGRLLMRDHGCIHHHGRNAEWSPCRACNRRLDLVTQFLSARSAGDRDAHQALARVRGLCLRWELDEPSEPGVGRSFLRAAASDLRRALGDADDQHDGSGT